MRNHAENFMALEADKTDADPSAPERTVDVCNRDSVLDFTNYYLQASSRPRTIEEVHNLTAAISRYKGPRIVRFATLESFLAGFEH